MENNPAVKSRLLLLDLLILSSFTVLITLQPYFLHGQINLFELGLYLPGIDAILKGHIPFRDFFHLRGPFELYLPALCMKVWGEGIAVLAAYFYAGTVLALVICVAIASQLYRTRLFLYLLVPVLVARTFPRVVFTYWGGMRYVVGLLAVLAAVRFFKSERQRWILAAGVFSSCAVFTSIEVGLCSIAAVGTALFFSLIFKVHPGALIRKACGIYILGILAVALPYGFYLMQNNALIAYGINICSVITNTPNIIDLSGMPDTPLKFLLAMLNPGGKIFKNITPAYLYLILFVFVALRARHRKLESGHVMLVCLGVYGAVMYAAAFRGIGAAAFEMALQPEKILLFFLLEEAYLFLKNKQIKLRKVDAFKLFAVVLILSSLGYSIQRFNHRFFAARFFGNLVSGKGREDLDPLSGKEAKTLTLERAKGMTVPLAQAQELEALDDFIRKNTAPDEAVFMFPELGTCNFIVDRPFVGRFAVGTLTWFNDAWHEELLADLAKKKPRYAVLTRELPEHFETVYFKKARSKRFYDEVVSYIKAHYHLEIQTPASDIYRLN